METILALLRKYKELIKYGFWGAVATVVNIGTFHVCYDLASLSNTASNLIAWLAAMLVAFVTNKLFVFESRNQTFKQNIQEFVSFAGFRLVSEVFDLGIMIWAVDMMHMNAMLWKVIANVIVIALNYLFSKFIIFKKSGNQKAAK